MAIKIKDKTPAVKAALKVLDEVGQKVDRWAELDAQIKKAKAKMEPLLNEQKLLREELLATQQVVLAAAGEKTLLPGASGGFLEFGPKASQVVAVNKPVMRELMGDETYFALAEVGVGSAREYLTPPELAQCLTEELVGARRVKYIAPGK